MELQNWTNREKIVFITLPFIATVLIVFGCIMSKYFDAFYLGLVSVLIGILYFNLALFVDKDKLKNEGN